MSEPDNDVHNNINLIYSYTEKEVEGFNKSIDNIASKLGASLGFSGVLLKFISDLPELDSHFWIKVFGSTMLLISIGCCAAGLFAKDAGNTIRAKGLIKPPEKSEEPNYYRMPEEEYRLSIVRQWIKHIDNLEEILDFRRGFLNASIGLLVAVSGLYALDVVLTSIH